MQKSNVSAFFCFLSKNTCICAIFVVILHPETGKGNLTGRRIMLEGKHNKLKFKELYDNYKSEMAFGLALLCLVVLSYGLADRIPLDFYIESLNPILNGSIAAVSLFGAWLMLRHHNGIHVRILWAGILLVWGILATLLLTHLVAYNLPISSEESISLRGRELIIGNVYAWLLLRYPVSVLRPGWQNIRRALGDLLPVAVIAAVHELFPIDLRWLLAIWPITWVVVLFFHISKYRRWCEENYSSMDLIDAQWIVRYIIMLVILGAAYTYMSFSYNASHAFTVQWLTLLMLVYSTEQILYRQDPWNLLRRAKAAKAAMEEDETGDVDPDLMSGEYKATLEQWMATEKPYLNPEFRLVDLREVLPLNRTYLSQLINSAYGCNFYQFVTNYRIEEAKRLMREKPDMKMHDIAEQCGFSSPVVFSRIFTRETGMSPSEWSQNHA